MMLHCNVVSHWLGTYTTWPLHLSVEKLYKRQMNSVLQGLRTSFPLQDPCRKWGPYQPSARAVWEQTCLHCLVSGMLETDSETASDIVDTEPTAGLTMRRWLRRFFSWRPSRSLRELFVLILIVAGVSVSVTYHVSKHLLRQQDAELSIRFDGRVRIYRNVDQRYQHDRRGLEGIDLDGGNDLDPGVLRGQRSPQEAARPPTVLERKLNQVSNICWPMNDIIMHLKTTIEVSPVIFYLYADMQTIATELYLPRNTYIFCGSNLDPQKMYVFLGPNRWVSTRKM